MAEGRLITLGDQVYEVVAEAPGGTSLFLVNRSLKARGRIAALERLLAEARADLARVELDHAMSR